MASTENVGLPSILIMLLTHLLLLAPVIYTVVLYSTDTDLFTWHPLLCVAGVGIFILEGIYSVASDPVTASKWSRATRVNLHMAINGVGLICIELGILFAYIYKNRNDSTHLATPHAKLGAAAIIITIIATTFGTVIKYSKYICPAKLNPLVFKVLHASLGIIATIILIAAMINGTYKSYWRGTDVGRGLVIASFVVGGILVLIKPLLATVKRAKVLYSPKKESSIESNDN